jgi:diaminopimelate epimerase
MKMWNPDGSQAEMCGNGIRCFARYVYADHPVQGVLTVETGAGLKQIRRVQTLDWVEVSMGRPVLNGSDIPVSSSANPVLDLELPDLDLKVTAVSMGNPHAVCFVADVDQVALETIGPRVEHHPLFPRRVNFHVCQVIDRLTLKMRTWERGAGLTLACGTGACATAVAAQLHQLVEPAVMVQLPGGALKLTWDGSGEVLMAGPADEVFRGSWPLEPGPASIEPVPTGAGERL